jgi:hypothetical protein
MVLGSPQKGRENTEFFFCPKFFSRHRKTRDQQKPKMIYIKSLQQSWKLFGIEFERRKTQRVQKLL